MFLLIVRYRYNIKLTLSCRIAMLVAEVAENGDSGYIESYIHQEIQGGLLVCVRNEVCFYLSPAFSTTAN